MDLFYAGGVEELATRLLQSVLENRTGPQRAGGLRGISSRALDLPPERTGGRRYRTLAVAYSAYLQTRMHGGATMEAPPALFAVERALEQLDSA